jgi:FtsZ-interacting cell division protein ZipA
MRDEIKRILRIVIIIIIIIIINGINIKRKRDASVETCKKFRYLSVLRDDSVEIFTRKSNYSFYRTTAIVSVYLQQAATSRYSRFERNTTANIL